MGVHGKGCISFVIGFGCNVPGCLSCRIIETKRERFITAVLVTLVPCSAVSVIVFGLVGKYVGLLWALGLYVFAMVLVFIAGKISSKLLIGEPVELIMPMPDYKTPQLKTIIYQTWDALKEFIFIAAPVRYYFRGINPGYQPGRWMPAISSVLSPVTVTWLGLPAITGILLIFGLRKELILVMLAAYLETTNFSDVADFAADDYPGCCQYVLYSLCRNNIRPVERIRMEKSNDYLCARNSVCYFTGRSCKKESWTLFFKNYRFSRTIC